MPRHPLDPADYYSYEVAKRWVQKLGITTFRGWWSAAKEGRIPEGIPKDPTKVYVEFTSWPDFLGTSHIPRRGHKYASIDVAMKYARERGIRTQYEWSQHCKEMEGRIPCYIPTDLRRVYGEEFNKVGGMRGFLGRAIMPYDKAVEYIREKGFSGIREFERWATSGDRSVNFPRHPHLTYKSQFESYRHFLGLPLRPRESEQKLKELVAVIEGDCLLKKSLERSGSLPLTMKSFSEMVGNSSVSEQNSAIIDSLREIEKAGYHQPLAVIHDAFSG